MTLIPGRPRMLPPGRRARSGNRGRFAMIAMAAWTLAGGSPLPASGQTGGMKDILKALDTEGRVELPGTGVAVSRADYPAGPDSLEAILFHPTGTGLHPALLLVPGFPKTARDVLPLGIRFSGQGMVVMAVTMPGFGRSGGTPDYCGPVTVAALETGLARLRTEAGVDSSRIAALGIYRGATAAAILAVRPNRLRAVVLASGVYDLALAYDEIQDEILRANIRKETGLPEGEAGDSARVLRERSPLLGMESLACPVLILHGADDRNAPVDQAELLRNRLAELEKPFEIRIFPELGRDLGMANVTGPTLEFLARQYGGP